MFDAAVRNRLKILKTLQNSDYGIFYKPSMVVKMKQGKVMMFTVLRFFAAMLDRFFLRCSSYGHFLSAVEVFASAASARISILYKKEFKNFSKSGQTMCQLIGHLKYDWQTENFQNQKEDHYLNHTNSVE